MPLQTTVKSVLNKTKRRDPWFLDDYTVNPYSGCSFNCWYCYIRGSKYGIHMEEKLAVKANAADVLEKQLAARAKKGQYGVIALASATDPYLQIEREARLTRRFLELILHYRFPVHVITKSDLVTRDFDLLMEIDRKAMLPADLERHLDNKVFITFSFSTLDDSVAKLFEPGATPPSVRLHSLKGALSAGLHAGVSLMPLLPLLSDTQDAMENFYNVFGSVGAHYIFPASLTLFGNGPSDSKALYMNVLRKNFPHLVAEYEAMFASSPGPGHAYQGQLRRRIESARRKHPVPDSILQR